ncbi:MAG: class I SAM-dependent methyltransferase [Chloroflexi bacterium]|nr:class I SAM-dependent methyltransferase [Chloroflexota bacterium]
MQPRLYTEFAEWFHLLTAPVDYAPEAAAYHRMFDTASGGTARTLLELGSGGGNTASHLKAWYTCTLVDLSPQMLALSRTINPDCEHLQGDMRDVRLGREFDCVFVHDAVEYMTTEADLRAAMATARAHCRPGGVALFVPDCVRETFAPSTDHGGHDGPDGRGLRYLEWTTDPGPGDTTYTVDFAYLLRDSDGAVHVEHDRHIFGVFPRGDWVRWMEGAGFAVRVEVMTDEGDTRDVFIGVAV